MVLTHTPQATEPLALTESPTLTVQATLAMVTHTAAPMAMLTAPVPPATVVSTVATATACPA